MPKYEIGTRVGALLSADEKTSTAYLLGYGTYEGDQIPPPELNVRFFGILIDHPNPCIKLDNGKLIFGCECWWGPEDAIKERVAKFDKTVVVDIKKERAKPESKTTDD